MATPQSSADYDLQTESYNMMVSYYTTGVGSLCHTWKACIYFGVCILILAPFSYSANHFVGRKRFSIFHLNIGSMFLS